MSSSEEDDFGQKVPPLSVYLKRILDKYPEGGQILKEIIQNADDAGATEVKFLYDNTDYPTTNLWSDDLREYHGPALYAYNNKQFTPQDWSNIQRPEQSGKREDPLKVGRFGLGFNSIYHITDLPSVLSGNWLGVFDPLENIFCYDPYKNRKYVNKPGKRWKLKGELLSPEHTPYCGQFAPYLGIFGCDASSFERGNFDGTLFRFPLRKNRSELSKNVITKERIMGSTGWITSFKDDIDLTLLFLKNVEKISVYERTGSGGSLELIQEARITDTVLHKLRAQKAEFLGQVKGNQEAGPTPMQVEIEVQSDTHKAVKKWIVVHQVKKTGLSPELRELAEDDELRLMPWVGAALEMTEESSNHENDGRIFCFLPLPPSQTTGLPVHIHGYFGLDDNRRSIKWPDVDSQNDKTAQWNQLLTSDAIPEAYAKLIMTAIQDYHWKADSVYAAWPDPDRVSEEWTHVFGKLFDILIRQQVFFCEVSGGRWVKLPDAVFYDETLHENQRVRESVLNAMLACGAPVVTLPNHVMKCLRMLKVHVKKITPNFVRDQLKRKTQVVESMDSQTKLWLLEYVLVDEAHSDLQGLRLLPLADGTFTSFNTSRMASKIFIATEEHKQALLPNMDAKFLDGNIQASLISKLKKTCKCTQLTLLTTSHVIENLRSALPHNWTASAQTTIIWCPGQRGQPPKSWLSEFWSWFQRRNENVTSLEGIPLIPLDVNSYSGPTTLLKITRIGPMAVFKSISDWRATTILPDEITYIIEKIGCFVVKNQPKYLSQSLLCKYIAAPDVEGVLQVLKFAGQMKICQALKDNPYLATHLRSFLAKLSRISQDDTVFLKQLQLFENVNGGPLMSINQCSKLAPNNYQRLPCNRVKRPLLACDEYNVGQLAKRLGADEVQFATYLDQYIFANLDSNFYSGTEAADLIQWTLGHSVYDHIVKKYSCIPTKSGKLLRPCQVIDPKSTQLITLLGDESVPIEPYCSGKLLESMRRIGMKSEGDVSAEQLLAIAKELDNHSQRLLEDTVKPRTLLEYLDKYHLKLQELVYAHGTRKTLAERLKSLSWVPCMDHRPSTYPSNIDWFGEQGQNGQKLFTPKQITLLDNATLIGGVMPILQMSHLNQNTASAFKWKHPLDVDSYENVMNVVRQLKMIVMIVQSHSEQNHPFFRQVHYIVREIYTFLAKSKLDLVKYFINEDPGVGRFQWVWYGKGFSGPESVAIKSGLDVDLKPYLNTLPDELAEDFRHFFRQMGISEKFTPTALTDVLKKIRDKNKQQRSQDEIKVDVNLSCAILKAITRGGPIKDEMKNDVLVPAKLSQTGSMSLVPVNQCLYRDRDWLTEELKDDRYSIIHEDIPNITAKHLGLQPLSQFVAPTDDLGYDLAGPHESIINAIKRNLDIYKEGVGIFKELIQNADDAGASEVKFLIDQRENEDKQERLLDPEMKYCQGPALWAYNDALFTDDDMKNICDIAAASKREKHEKIGRFGLGFTSVYHVTDVPSLVSGPYVMMFDPRMTHLKSRIHNPSQPGVKLDLRKESHRYTVKTHPDQFQPYDKVFGCNILDSCDHYNGTLFRLPLRTAHQASHKMENLISDKVYHDKSLLQKLILTLKDAAPTLLLFTQNVKKVSVFELKTGSHDGSGAKEILSLNVNLVKQLPRAISCPPDTQASPLQQQCNILRATSQWMSRGGNTPPPETTCMVEVATKSKLSKSTKKSTSKQFWLLSSCASTGAAFARACQREGKKQGILPCAGVAALLHRDIDGLVPTPTPGQLYSFLPLEVPTGLPVHFNASFALQPNRRHIWSKATKSMQPKEFEAEWNHDLMTDVLCRVFLNLLVDLTQMQDYDTKHDFQTLWPNLDTCESDFHPFLAEFYKRVCCQSDSMPPVIHNGSKWVTLDQCLFVGADIRESRIDSEATILLNQECNPRKVVSLSESVMKSIEKSGAHELVQENSYDMKRLYRDVFFVSIDDVSPGIRNPMVTHLLDARMGTQKTRMFDDLLKTTECIPVSPDGTEVDKPTNLVQPDSLVGKLFDDSDGRFPYAKELTSQERLLSLTELGMATTTLSWEDICERANSVIDMEENSGMKTAVKRINIILRVMKNVLDTGSNPSVDEKTRLSNTVFLPVLQKSKDYPLEWWADKIKLLNGKKLFGQKHANIIGSVAAILDENQLEKTLLTTQIKDILGINTEVAVDDVVSQLQVLVQSQNVKETLDVCKAVYTFLEHKLCTSSRSATGNEVFDIKEGQEDTVSQLKELTMFWVHRAFVSADKLAFQWSEITDPYLYKVPREVVKFKKLFSICGVRDKFEIDDYIAVLQELQNTRGEDELNKDECKIAMTMVREICGSASNNYDLEEKDISVPDTQSVLRSRKEMTFNDDAPWLQQSTHFVFTHKDVTWAQAEKLGIVAARYKRAQEFSSLMGFAHEFGQKEELTDRLKDILKAYPGKSEILKELLQNADDAKATEIHIIYDRRSHPSTKIVCDSWATMQERPAICVYNNKTFSDEDIKGIQQVGIGGKRSDAETTGQYGIGFNSVYHMTDCPSFISDDKKLGIFDPHLKYILGANDQKPGILFDPVDDLRASFEDMLSGYLADYIQLEGGTLFRFPLRQHGDTSNISDSTYSTSTVEDLMRAFKSTAFDSLLFLNHIKTIKLSEITKSGEMKEWYRVSAEMTEDGRQKREEMAAYISVNKGTNVMEIQPKTEDYMLHIKDSKSREEDWLVVQQFGFSEQPDINVTHDDIGRFLPRVGVAALVKEHNVHETKPLSYVRHGISYPVATTKNVKKVKHAYCFLPLPIDTGLPVSVNGHFALDPARRYLWKDPGFSAQSFRSAWNENLISKALAPAYATLLHVAGRKYVMNPTDMEDAGIEKPTASSDLDWYHNLFPTVNKDTNETGPTGIRKGEWAFLAEQTLAYIASAAVKVLPIINAGGVHKKDISWHEPINECDQAFFDTMGSDTSGELIRNFLLSSGFNLLCSPMKIHDSFEHSGVDVQKVTPASLRQFMHSEKCVIGDLPCGVEESTYADVKTYLEVLKYVLRGVQDPQELVDLPLQLLADLTVGVFSAQDAPYLSTFMDLLPALRQKFLSRDVYSILYEFASKLESSVAVNVWKDLTPDELAQHLDTVLPSEWQNVTHCIKLTDATERDVDIKWLQLLWKYLCSRDDADPIHPLRSWPIIPLKDMSLISPANGTKVLNLFSSDDERGFQSRVIHLLRKLKCPEVASESIEHHPLVSKECVTKLLKSYVVSPGECKDVLTLLDHLMSEGLVNFEAIGDYEAETLLQYFQEDVPKYNQLHIDILKKMPLYEQYNGKLTSVGCCGNCHLLSGTFPDVPQDLWAKCDCIFLTPKHHLQQLLQGIGATAIDVFGVYKKYIIPHLHTFSHKFRLAHLKYIRDTLIPYKCNEEQRKYVIRVLSSIHLIRAKDGNLQTAEYFFDPNDEVFAAMEDKRYHLPKEFSDDYRWTSFFGKLGLKTEVTQTLFLQYANRVAARALRCTGADFKSILHQSKLLAGELSDNAELREPSFFKDVSKIKFIPSAKVKPDFCEIHPPFSREGGQTIPFICYHGNISEHHMELAWTSCFLLPQWAIPSRYKMYVYPKRKNEDLHHYLGISDEQSLDSVIAHCQNICDRMAKQNQPETKDRVPKKIRDTLSSVLIKLYECFQQNLDKQDLKTRLTHTPLVLVDYNKMLIRANQLAYNFGPLSKEELQPYLYTPPRTLGKYEALLQHLGTEENATPAQLSRVLAEIKDHCKDDKMHPNEKKKALSATKALFYYLSKAADEKSLADVARLYLPSTHGKLQLSTDLYHGSKHLVHRIDSSNYEFVLPLVECGCEQSMNIGLLPERLQPTNIGKIVREKISPHAERCVADASCEYRVHYQEMLCSEDLMISLTRIIRHQQGPQFLNDERRDQIAKLKENVRVHCMKKLECMIFSPSKDEYIPRSENQSDMFMDEAEKGFDLYMKHGDIPADALLLRMLASNVNRILSWQMKDMSDLQTLLSKSVEHFHDILTKLKIPEYEHIEAIAEDQNAPGKPVPEDIVHLLNDDPINIFRVGDVVALRKSTMEGGTESEFAEYVFAEVTDVLTQSDDSEDTLGLRRKYRVDIGGKEPVEVSGNDLYKFKRPEEPKPQDLEVYTGAEGNGIQRDRPEATENVSLDEAKSTIKETLEAAFKLPEDERKKVIRRLYRRWHPDKNPGNEDMANAAFKYLRQQIERLESGKPDTETFSRFYEEWNNEARYHRRQQESYQSNYRRQRNRFRHSGRRAGSYVPPSFNLPTPNPREARVWFRQAEQDLLAANNDLYGESPSYNWVCFKVHQSAEKALKAGKFSIDGKPKQDSTGLLSLAYAVQSHSECPPRLDKDAAELDKLGCDFTNTRYPRHNSAPGDVYGRQQAEDAVKVATRLVENMRTFIDIQKF